jgi:hypothetical protein
VTIGKRCTERYGSGWQRNSHRQRADMAAVSGYEVALACGGSAN